MKKLCLYLLLTCVLLTACSSPAAAAIDFRGVWVSTIYNIDYPNAATTDSTALQKQADTILDNCVDMGLTDVILQVRPSADALYSSELYPWSKYLTGVQGVAPDNDFDPLTYWVTAAHARGLKLHAWLNPYRVAVSATDFEGLAADHPARLHPEWVVEYGGKYYFDPGLPETRQLIVEGVREIVERYDVDGIHFDDYFYPALDFDDADTYAQYGEGYATLGDWRRANNDTLIRSLHTLLAAYPGVSFGVSPAGIWANAGSLEGGSATRGNQTYFTACADTRKWVKEGWLDYICPQLYWPIGYEIADYEILARWWADVTAGTGVELYIGMPDYRFGTDEHNNVWHTTAPLEAQLKLNRTIPEIRGEVHFTYSTIALNPELKTLYEETYGETGSALPKIQTVLHNSYIQGDNGNFRPQSGLTRAEAAVLLSRLMVDDEGQVLYNDKQSYGSLFTDVAAGMWFSRPIGFVSQNGVMVGSGTLFRPGDAITRAEFATLLTRFTGLDNKATSPLTDIDKHWGAPYIRSAYQYGLIMGYEDNTFRPQNNVTRAEAVTMLNRLMGRVPDKQSIDGNSALNPFGDLTVKHWAYYQIMEATHSHQYTKSGATEIWR